MRLDMQRFADEHLDAAGELLAARHRADRERTPLLSPRFGEAAIARRAVEAAWRMPDAEGRAAFVDNHMVGYLIGAPKFDVVMGRTAWVTLAGHALARDQSVEVYRELYASLSPVWLAKGLFAQYALIPAGDQAALMAWFALSFGQEQCYGLRALTEADATPPPAESADALLVIRRATPDDLDAMVAVADTIPRYQTGSPVYAPFLRETMTPDGLRADYSELLGDPAVALWLALRVGRIIGYQLYTPEPASEDNPLIAEQMIELAIGATLPEARRQGVGRALTAQGFAWAYAQGARVCLTDWRVTNLLASRFWPTRGFAPAAYRLVRRIDERIAWARR